MKKTVKHIFLLLLLIVIIPSTAIATELNSYHTEIILHSNGNAKVEMIWDYMDDTGTEHYIPFKKDISTITNLKVERNGIEYETIENWDPEESFENKKDRAGLVKKEDEVELCFGIGEYGHNIYKVSFDIDYVVKDLNDAQMMHYRLLNDFMSEAPNDASFVIKRANGESLDEFNPKYWAFGFEGAINLHEGEIVGKSTDILTTDDYIDVLVEFEPGSFELDEKAFIDTTFDEVKSEAFAYSDYDDYFKGRNEYAETNDEKEEKAFTLKRLPFIILSSIGLIFAFLGKFAMFLPLLFVLLVVYRVYSGSKEKRMKDEVQAVIDSLDTEYFNKNYPYSGNLDEVYFLNYASSRSQIKNITIYYLLKFIKEGIIVKEERDQAKFLNKSATESVLVFVKDKEILDENLPENMFYKILRDIAGDDILSPDEMTYWFSDYDNAIELDMFEDKLIAYSEKHLMEKGFIYKVDPNEGKKRLFGKRRFLENASIKQMGNGSWVVKENDPNDPNNHYSLTRSGQELVKNLLGFKRYLNNYSLLSEREVFNVHIWDKYMLFAALFGIAETVNNEFRGLYPGEISLEQKGDTFTTVNHVSASMAMNYSKSQESQRTRSSGGGGSTSRRGGGGSHRGGGSSGGGTR